MIPELTDLVIQLSQAQEPKSIKEVQAFVVNEDGGMTLYNIKGLKRSVEAGPGGKTVILIEMVKA